MTVVFSQLTLRSPVYGGLGMELKKHIIKFIDVESLTLKHLFVNSNEVLSTRSPTGM